MYAVFLTGGKQYRVSEGDTVKVEKVRAEAGETVEFDKVLMIGKGGDDVSVGSPYIDGGKVTAKVADQGRHRKIEVIKFKRRQNYLRHYGHRQHFTELEITGISG